MCGRSYLALHHVKKCPNSRVRPAGRTKKGLESFQAFAEFLIRWCLAPHLAAVNGVITENLFDAQQLIVLRHPVCPAQ